MARLCNLIFIKGSEKILVRAGSRIPFTLGQVLAMFTHFCYFITLWAVNYLWGGMDLNRGLFSHWPDRALLCSFLKCQALALCIQLFSGSSDSGPTTLFLPQGRHLAFLTLIPMTSIPHILSSNPCPFLQFPLWRLPVASLPTITSPRAGSIPFQLIVVGAALAILSSAPLLLQSFSPWLPITIQIMFPLCLKFCSGTCSLSGLPGSLFFYQPLILAVQGGSSALRLKVLCSYYTQATFMHLLAHSTFFF